MDIFSLSTFSLFAGAGSVALVLALLAGFTERRERRRRNLDRVSTVPWGLVSVLLSLLGIILISTAAKLWFAPGG